MVINKEIYMKKILLVFILILSGSLLYGKARIKIPTYEDLDGKVDIVTSYDEFDQITWYQPKCIPDDKDVRILYSTPQLYCYIGFKKSSGNDVNMKWLRLKTMYTDKSWLFIDTLYLLYDGTVKKITLNKYKDIKTEVGYLGFIHETIDIIVDDDLMYFLEQLSQGKDVKIRYSGSEGYVDYKIYTIDKKALKIIIDKYKELD